MNEQKLASYRQRLSNDFPELSIKSIKCIFSGWHHDALEVNESIIFRIPHNLYGVDVTPQVVSYETALLKLLQGKMPVAIPDPSYIAPVGDYFGYTKLAGVLLQGVVSTFDDQDWQKLKQDWVNIASTLHQLVTLEQAKTLGIPDFEQPGPSAAERIFTMPGISSEVKEFATEIIRQQQVAISSESPRTFIHNDLQFHNILVDPDSKRITGVIDWTDSCVGPLAREFSIDEWMQDDLLSQVAALYEAKTGIAVDIKQARMWRSLEELGDYVEHTEAGKLQEAAKTLARIKHLIP